MMSIRRQFTRRNRFRIPRRVLSGNSRTAAMKRNARFVVLTLIALMHSACNGSEGNDAGSAGVPLAVSLEGAGIVASSPANGAPCPTATCTEQYKPRTLVNLTAIAAPGSTFTGWDGACSGTSAICTLTMDAAKSAIARFSAVPACSSEGSITLASTITDASGQVLANNAPNRACPKAHWGQVTGVCHGNYALQPNAYGTPPANTNFTMWSQNSACWGVRVTEPANPKFVYWNAPIVTRGYSFGYRAPLNGSEGLQVSRLNAIRSASQQPCPETGESHSVCLKWSMEVPGVTPQSTINTATVTHTNWDAMIDVYFHAVSSPSSETPVVFDLQVYQMVMDWQAGNGPNWATNMLHRYTTKTIGGVKYVVTVNTQSPGTEGSNWVGHGGSYNAVSVFALPTLPTSKSATGTGSYLWGTPSALHDIGGLIAWLSQPQTINGTTGIFDDAGKLLYDNVRKTSVSGPLIDPAYFLTGLNSGFEVVQADASTPEKAGNSKFTTTDFWIALPGEAVGK